MRLLSQNNEYDIPYDGYFLSIETANVSLDSNRQYKIVANPISGVGIRLCMGVYPTKEEAQAEMLGPTAMLQSYVVTSLVGQAPRPEVYAFALNSEQIKQMKEGE